MIYEIYNETSLEELKKRRAALEKRTDETMKNTDNLIRKNYEMARKLREARKRGVIADLDDLRESCEIALVAVNEASFKFLPKFKEDPELKRYYKDIKEAKDLLEQDGKHIKDGNKYGACALRILDIMENIQSVIDLSLVIFNPFLMIPCYLICRLWSWGWRSWREEVIKDYASKVVKGYRELMNETDNEELKKKYQDAIDKINSKIDYDFD